MQRTNTNLMTDVVENIELKLLFQSWCSTNIVLHRLYRWFSLTNLYDCATNESTVMHQFESYLLCLSFMNIFCSLRKTRWIEKGLWNRNFNPMFLTTSATSCLRPLHYDVECFECCTWKYFQSCKLMFSAALCLTHFKRIFTHVFNICI